MAAVARITSVHLEPGSCADPTRTRRVPARATPRGVASGLKYGLIPPGCLLRKSFRGTGVTK